MLGIGGSAVRDIDEFMSVVSRHRHQHHLKTSAAAAAAAAAARGKGGSGGGGGGEVFEESAPPLILEVLFECQDAASVYSPEDDEDENEDGGSSSKPSVLKWPLKVVSSSLWSSMSWLRSLIIGSGADLSGSEDKEQAGSAKRCCEAILRKLTGAPRRVQNN